MTKDQEKKVFIEKMSPEKEHQEAQRIVYYMLHHTVRKELSTTQIRVVYDCFTSAQILRGRHCLIGM